MLAIARRTDALAAAAILVKMSRDGAVAPGRIVDDGSGGHHSTYFGPMIPASFLIEWNEGSMQSCWRRVRGGARHATDGFVERLGQSMLSTDLSNPQWTQDLYNLGLGPVSDDNIVGMFDALEKAIYSDLDGLDAALAKMDLKRLAPEFIVGIPRALFPLREHLFNWSNLVLKAWIELSSRRGLDVSELLQGLL
jgi:hypothetical protein